MRWWYILGAFACIVVSVVYMALFVVVTKGRSNVRNLAKAGFVVVCLALAALAFMELGSANKFGTFIPAVLVGVTLISDHRRPAHAGGHRHRGHRPGGLASWIEGFRGSDLVAGAAGLRLDHRHHHLDHRPGRGSPHRPDRPPSWGPAVVDGLCETLENIGPRA